MQDLAAEYIPKGYALGRAKVEARYGIVIPWTDADNANLQVLLNRHAEVLKDSFTRMEQEIIDGKPAGDVVKKLHGRLHMWSWVLSPALAMGIAGYIDGARNHIGRAEGVPAEDIGVIWDTAHDPKVCPKCQYLNGRWFSARDAYVLAANVHPGCRCPQHFDVGDPSDALVGPVPNYRLAGVIDIFRGLN